MSGTRTRCNESELSFGWPTADLTTLSILWSRSTIRKIYELPNNSCKSIFFYLINMYFLWCLLRFIDHYNCKHSKQSLNNAITIAAPENDWDHNLLLYIKRPFFILFSLSITFIFVYFKTSWISKKLRVLDGRKWFFCSRIKCPVPRPTQSIPNTPLPFLSCQKWCKDIRVEGRETFCNIQTRQLGGIFGKGQGNDEDHDSRGFGTARAFPLQVKL